MYVSEGCQPQNRLYYLDLSNIPRADDTGALDFSSVDFNNGEQPLGHQSATWDSWAYTLYSALPPLCANDIAASVSHEAPYTAVVACGN